MMYFLLQRIVPLLFFITFVKGIQFFVTPSPFMEYDEDVQVKCELSDETANSIVTIHSIKIQVKRNGTWTTQANINYDEIIDSNFADMSITGWVASPSESYLRLTWFQAAPYFFGTYRCEAVATDKNGDFKSLKSPDLTIAGIPRTTHNLIDLLRNNHNRVFGEIQEVLNRTYQVEVNENEKFQNATMHRNRLEQRVNSVQDMLQDKVLTMLSDLITRVDRVQAALNSTS